MMVDEFVSRQRGTSPINGDTYNHNDNTFQNSNMMGMQSGRGSPMSDDMENFPAGYDLAAHLKRKELFSQRKQREFIPDNKKDDSYWDRRRRNNEAAKRSREKRRFNDMILEQKVVELTKENHVLKAQLDAIKDKYNICGENLVSVDQIMATLPTAEQVLSITKRTKIMNTVPVYPICSSPFNQTPLRLESPPPPPPVQIQSPQIQRTFMYERSPTPIEMRIKNHENEPENDPDIIFNHRHHINAYPDPYQINHPTVIESTHPELVSGNILNLSRRVQSPYEVSSGTGSGAASGDDEHEHQIVNESTNILPLKLRHKSHLGDKDAASALLALQNIKQEPILRTSPGSWENGDGSSDERDSGISIGGVVEWTSPIRPKQQPPINILSSIDCKDAENSHLKSQLARLESEVATIKNMMILNTNTSGAGATAAAQ